MTPLDRKDYPKTKLYDIVQLGPTSVEVVAGQETTGAELADVLDTLAVDMIAFARAGRKLS